MSKFNGFLEEKVMPVAAKIGAQRHLLALRDGIIATMPFIVIGSFFMILANLPIPGYADWMTSIFGPNWAAKLSYPVDATFNIMSLIAAFAVAYRLAETYKLDAMSAGTISVAAFMLSTPFSFQFMPVGAKAGILVTGAISKAFLSSKGLFIALLIGILATEIYRWVVKKNIVIKLPSSVPPSVGKSFAALIPGFLVIFVVWVIRLLVELTPYGSINNMFMTILGEPLKLVGLTLGGTIVAELFVTVLWACGLHGTNIVKGVMEPIWVGAMGDNMTAYQAHQPLPHIVTQQFFDNFIHIGGTGVTFGLVLAMVLFAKSQQMKQLGRLALAPGIFNINEPVIFGLPIVLNPIMIIPFILTSIVTVIVTFLGMDMGLVAKPVGIAVPWTMPPIISGYLASGGHISGAVMNIVNIVISFVIYLPFFKIYDKAKKREEDEMNVGEKKELIV
ncbi:PTS cellobiose transporter subunit IIC [Neobacillus sp. PS3-12]|jgi:cellobiose PTS system EIIC component|uniref:PTS cellobiose transporter subunit IIC n=1 Tax=Neobacillus sp. PS3-12 TaxID=3070677 RepID=UPI0027E0721C|nr:PTS cellobiose transporter subunit IIC [Neobacillus sp. PS3-12]WML50742.1 PTS cellobiose transporter subunit IIC [Neobacillus sp. PS3-12]